MPKLVSSVALLVLPALAAYLMRRYMVPAKLPLPVIPPAVVEKARAVVVAVGESPAAKRARSAAARALSKGGWSMQAFSERIVVK